MRREAMMVLLLGTAILTQCGCASATTKARAMPTPPQVDPAPQTTQTACQSQSKLDDRSSARQLILSYYNAINHQDWTRAYSYFSILGQTFAVGPDFALWRAGYADTACTIVSFTGIDIVVTNDFAGYANVGAAVVVPVRLTSIRREGDIAIFVGSYAVQFDPQSTLMASDFIALAYSQLNQIA